MVDEIKYILKVETSDGVEKLSVELDDAAKELEILKKNDGLDLLQSIQDSWQKNKNIDKFISGYYNNGEFYKKYYDKEYADKLIPVLEDYYYDLGTKYWYQYQKNEDTEVNEYVELTTRPDEGSAYNKGYYDGVDFYRNHYLDNFVGYITKEANAWYHDLKEDDYYICNGSSYSKITDEQVNNMGLSENINFNFADLYRKSENKLDTVINTVSANSFDWTTLNTISPEHFLNDELNSLIADKLGVNSDNPVTASDVINKVNKLATSPSGIIPVLYSNGELIESSFGNIEGTFCEGNDTRLTDKALIDHASSTTIHGEGTSEEYGHVKLQHNLSTLVTNDGAISNQSVSIEFNGLIELINELINLISSDSPDIPIIE